MKKFLTFALLCAIFAIALPVQAGNRNDDRGRHHSHAYGARSRQHQRDRRGDNSYQYFPQQGMNFDQAMAANQAMTNRIAARATVDLYNVFHPNSTVAVVVNQSSSEESYVPNRCMEDARNVGLLGQQLMDAVAICEGTHHPSPVYVANLVMEPSSPRLRVLNHTGRTVSVCEDDRKTVMGNGGAFLMGGWPAKLNIEFDNGGTPCGRMEKNFVSPTTVELTCT